MTTDADTKVSLEEANESFSKVAQLAEEKGHVVVLRNGRPKLLVIDLDTEPQIKMTDEEKIEFVATRILRKHIRAFEELAR